jgi:hypothetical protein
MGEQLGDDVPGSFYRAPEALVQQRVELRWDRDRVWIEHRGQGVAVYQRCYQPGSWQPAPRLRPEPPTQAPRPPIPGPRSFRPSSATTPLSAHDHRGQDHDR